MREYLISPYPKDEEIEDYWDFRVLSKLFNNLPDSRKFKIGDVILIDFNTQDIGFLRNFREDFKTDYFKIDYRLFQYGSYLGLDKRPELLRFWVITPMYFNS